MKFLHLFGKSTTTPLRDIRQTPAAVPSAAEETTRKIDAIESEISAELSDGGTDTAEPAGLLTQRIDEASLLYASRQPAAAEALLLEAVAQQGNSAQHELAWMMLLELACIAGNQTQFEERALRYAQHFETSPPQWRSRHADPAATVADPPVLTLRGKLGGSTAPALERLDQQARQHTAFRIQLDDVTAVDDDGCTGLLRLLEQWLVDGRQVELLPAPSLTALLRTQLNDRPAGSSRGVNDDDGHAEGDGAPGNHHHSRWRLLLELLHVNDETEAHEDACMAYSLVHEMSPPAPLLPRSLPSAVRGTDALALPADINYPVDALLESLQASLRASTAKRATIVLDCSRLQLIEFNAAAPLLAGLARLADGKPVEWYDLSCLLSTLLQLVGGADRLRIVNRKP